MGEKSSNDVLVGGPEACEIVIVDYDPDWPRKFEAHAGRIRVALGERALHIEHIGSTSVPELAAKPIVDIDLTVVDSADEPSYLPALEAAGYILRVREPDWHQHRMMRTPERDIHLHIFSPGAAELFRHLSFRNWLRAHPDDRQRYESTKRELARQAWEDMNSYAVAKTEVIESILGKALPEK